jgi:putative ABC transport system substrate-binding protein
MRRRDVIAGLGGAAALPLAARAQQQAMPVIGYFNSGKAATQTNNVAAFRLGLKEATFIEGHNVTIEFHWGDNQFGRLPALAADVIARRPAVIVSNTLAALRAKAATTTIPIVFTTGSDPVRDGLVSSLSRPGGNITGVVFLSGTVGTKRLELLHQLVPKATTIAMLVYPNTSETEAERKEVEAAAHAIGQQLMVLDISRAGDIEPAVAMAKARGAGALLTGTGPFTANNREAIVAAVARHAIPAMYSLREYAEAGGLMSYGASLPGAFHQAGLYAGRVLKGEKPGDLPVMQSSKFEFIINLRTAKALGLEFHPQLLGIADEVIE